MNKKVFAVIQIIIAVLAIAYALLPDFIIGPIDDLFVLTIATVTEFILGLAKPHITVVPNPD